MLCDSSHGIAAGCYRTDMPREPRDLTTYGGSLLDSVEENIDLSPSEPDPALEPDAGSGAPRSSVVDLAARRHALRHPSAPGGRQVRRATLGGLAWQRRKAERAKDLVVALYDLADLLQRTRFESVQKVEFEDLVEDVLRRFSEQRPTPNDATPCEKIFLKIVEEPREHVENRLLIRLADELPSEALKALLVLDRKLTQEERVPGVGYGALAIRLGLPNATKASGLPRE